MVTREFFEKRGTSERGFENRERVGCDVWEILTTLRLGSDIDIRVIKHGKTDKKSGEPVDVWTNFQDYGLPPPVGRGFCPITFSCTRARST